MPRLMGILGTEQTTQMDGAQEVDGLCRPPLGNVVPELAWAPGSGESVSGLLVGRGAL